MEPSASRIFIPEISRPMSTLFNRHWKQCLLTLVLLQIANKTSADCDNFGSSALPFSRRRKR